jgi:DNA-binding beta-propeller fold protein YncE
MSSLDRDRRALIIVVTATLVARALPAWLLGAEVSDLSIYRHMALTVLRNQDIYDIPTFFPYTPFSLFLPVAALQLSTLTGVPFHLTMKLFPLLGDLGTATLVYLVARRRWPTRTAMLAGLFFAFNPVSILVTGLHGNIMPLSVFFAFWAYYLAEFGEHRRSYVLSALALGIAIGLRSWPVLLTPLLARPGKLNWGRRIVYVVVAALPSVLVLAPYMLFDYAGVLREAFDYKSTPDFGWVAIWRYWRFLNVDNIFMPWPKDWIASSRFYFLTEYVVLVGFAYLRPRAIDTAGWIIAALLLDYTMLGGVAAQYYSWIIPFLVLRPYFGLTFTAVATGAMLGFYLMWHPGILFGPYQPFAYTRSHVVLWNLSWLAALWAVGLLWLLGFLAQVVRSLWGAKQAAVAVAAPPTVRTTVRGSWVDGGIVVLAGTVALALALEIPYLLRSQQTAELPAHLAWVLNQRGHEPGQFSAPVGVAVGPSGDIYVADIANARVQRFSSTGTFLSSWPQGEKVSPAFEQPCDVAASATGAVYVLDSAGRIVRLEEDGGMVLVVDLAPWSVFSPRGLAVDDTRHRFYVSDTGKGRVLVVGMDGTLIDAWGGVGKAFSFDVGWGIAVDTRGNVFVGEQGNSRVRKLSPEGAVLAEWWVRGDLYDIAVGPDDHVYVTASDRARLWVYDDDGREVGQVNDAFEERRLPRTRGVAIGAPGDVILSTESAVIRLLLDSPLPG